MSKINLIMCVVMTFVLCIMTLGYVALQERIDVEVEGYKIKLITTDELVNNL